MTVADLLDVAEAHGAKFSLTGGKIRCQHPAGADLGDLLRALGARRDQAARLLSWRCGLGAGRGVSRSWASSRAYSARLLRQAGEQRRRARDTQPGPLRRRRLDAAKEEVAAARAVRLNRPGIAEQARRHRTAVAPEAAA